MRNRIDKLGVAEPEIRKQGIEPDRHPARRRERPSQGGRADRQDRAARVLRPPGRSDRPVGRHAGLRPVPDRDRQRLQPPRGPAGEGETGDADGVLPVRQEQEADRRPDATRASASSIAKHPTRAEGREGLRGPGEDRRHHLHADAPERRARATRTIGTTYYYLFKYDPTNPDEDKRIPEMTGGELKSSGHAGRLRPVRPAGRPPRVHRRRATTSSSGSRATSTSAAGSGRRRSSSRSCSTATSSRSRRSTTRDPSLSNGISGGGQITNIGKFGEAKDLAIVLQTGALPLEFKQIERSDVSATLGKDSLKQAKTAALDRPARRRDLPAHLLPLPRRDRRDRARRSTPRSSTAAILLLNVTLTLPGFAGLILTIGVAADANVVIFERIKEEVRSGKSIRQAISSGYQRGFHTILDANVVTCITAFVLFAAATARSRASP